MAQMNDAANGKPALAPVSSRRGAGSVDFATVAGLAIALGGILGGLVLEKGKLSDIAQLTAAMIVLGGTFGAVLITNPLPLVLKAFAGVGQILFVPQDRFHSIIEEIITYSTKARKKGIVSLEADAADASDPFLSRALNLAVDGTDLQILRQMMNVEIGLEEQRAEAEAKVWESAGGYAPTIGIIGAVLGLIQVMKHLENIKEVGSGIAVAFVATVYGVASSNIIFLPFANKLRARSRKAALLREMILEGVIGIVEGLNPKLIRQKLDAYCDSQPVDTGQGQGVAAAGQGGRGGTIAA